MNKVWVTTIVTAIFLGSLFAFLGIGYGANALSAVSSSLPNYQSTPINIDNALEWKTNITSYTSAGQIPTTAISPSGQSTAIAASLDIWAPSFPGCNQAANPAWAPGVGASYGYWSISYGGQPFIITYGGVQTSVGAGGAFFVSENSTGDPFFCDNADGKISTQLSGSPQPFMPIAFSLDGVYAAGSVLSVSFFLQATNCDGSSNLGINGPVCQAVSNAIAGNPTGYGLNLGSANGPDTGVATASIDTQSGFAWIQNTDRGQLVYNGGTAHFTASTGYGGPNGYTAVMDYPLARGGGPDSAFGSVTVPSFEPAYAFTMRVPSDASANSSTSGWNEFEVVLTAEYAYMGSTSVGVDISPLYQPGQPVITYTTSGTYTNPQVGDSIVFSFTAAPSAHSANVSSFDIWIYYSQGNTPPASQPPCNNAWVTSCPGPEIVPVSTAGGNATWNYPSFTVSPPPGYTSLIVQARSSTSTSQVSFIATNVINIVPQNCQNTPGENGCPPLKDTANAWTYIGAILLAIILVSGSVLLVLWAPLPIYVRYAIPILVGGVITILWVFGDWTSLFAIGAPLGSKVA